MRIDTFVRSHMCRACVYTRHPDCNTNSIYITSQQDPIISYCKYKDVDEEGMFVCAPMQMQMQMRVAVRVTFDDLWHP